MRNILQIRNTNEIREILLASQAHRFAHIIERGYGVQMRVQMWVDNKQIGQKFLQNRSVTLQNRLKIFENCSETS